MELAIMIFLTMISGILLMARNFALTRLFVGFVIIYLGIEGTLTGVITSYNLLLTPITPAYQIMLPYTAGNTLALVYMLIMLFGGLGICYKEMGA